MEVEDLLESHGADVPMTNAFKLLCEDALPKIDKKLHQKQKSIAEKVKNELNSAKLKAKFSYKKLDYWTEFGIKHPLYHLQSAVEATTSSVADFKWQKPKNITILDRQNQNQNQKDVQIYIEIADELFGNRDFLNLTYPMKRAHFLCAVVKILSGKFEKIEFSAGGIHADDAIFPDLIVDGVKIKVFNNSCAKSKRFVPTIGNLRPATCFGNKLFENLDIATPRFNQRMLWSFLEAEIMLKIQETLKGHPTARLAISLVQNLFENRHLSIFSTVILPARVFRLISQGQITEKQEILTVLRIIFRDFVSWSIDDVEYVDPEGEDLSEDVTQEYSEHFDVNLIYDHLNIAANVTRNHMNRMKEELSTCLPLLGQVYTFDGVFIEKFPIFAQYDHYARLQVDMSHLKNLTGEFAIDAVDSSDVITHFIRDFELKIQKTMEERYEFVGIHEIEQIANSWNTSDYAASVELKTFIVGFRSTSSWKSPLTVGPPAQTDKAREFRDLWKGSSELRKFADTRICECVVWAEQPSDKVPHAILQFVLKNMYELPKSCLSWRTISDDVDAERRSAEDAAKAFAELSAVLRGLKGLPLMITNVHGISGYLRGTEPAYPSVFAAPVPPSCSDDHALPEIGKIPLFTPALTVHIKLEYSGRWGNDVEAIRRLTSSFYVKIAERLREKNLCAVPTVDQLFVLQSGIVFKIVVVHDRILSILEEGVEKLKDSGAARIESSLQGIRLAAWKKKFIAEPLLQLSLQSFSTSHKFFGSTVQLFKKWLGSKLLSGHLNDHIIELLVVAAINKKGSVEPQSTWSSFVRLLHLIATHPWPARPLIVDFGAKSWNEEERAKLEETFIKMRPILPPMVIIHEEDHLGNKFTRDHPQGIVLNRLVALAQEALRILEKQTVGEKTLDLQASLLQENLKPYDAVIELEPSAVVRKKPILERRPTKSRKIPVVELDPIDELIYQLNNNFHQVAMFFYNKYGGHKIGVMFKPQEAEVPAKISRCTFHKSVSESTLRLNKLEILENIQILGDGVVSSVNLQKS
uniref:Nucleolar protein 6 n=1 Tax=Caenorhabditis japonica TaxID=281687 RepID=A0A8R1I488_CAEJA